MKLRKKRKCGLCKDTKKVLVIDSTGITPEAREIDCPRCMKVNYSNPYGRR